MFLPVNKLKHLLMNKVTKASGWSVARKLMVISQFQEGDRKKVLFEQCQLIIDLPHEQAEFAFHFLENT